MPHLLLKPKGLILALVTKTIPSLSSEPTSLGFPIYWRPAETSCFVNWTTGFLDHLFIGSYCWISWPAACKSFHSISSVLLILTNIILNELHTIFEYKNKVKVSSEHVFPSLGGSLGRVLLQQTLLPYMCLGDRKWSLELGGVQQQEDTQTQKQHVNYTLYFRPSIYLAM